MYCQNCGHKNEQDAAFCTNCGAAINQAYPTPQQYEQLLHKKKKQIRGLVIGISITGSLLFIALLFVLVPLFVGLALVADEQLYLLGSADEFIILDDDYDYRVDLTNARAICTAVNSHNALNPDDIIDDTYSLDAAKEKAYQLWPTFVEDEEAAWEYVTVSADGFATVNSP